MGKYCRALVIIIAAVFLLGRMGYVLEANYDGNQAMNGFYQLERDTVDVVFYGSSHIYAGVNTVKLWDDYGIAAYNLAGTMQTLWNSYYNMVETLKYQSPRMMVVDLYGILIEDEYYGSTNVIKNVSSMRLSLNKVENIQSSVPKQEFLSYLLSYPLTHDSYKELRQGNYIRETNNIGGKWYKGYKPSYAVTEYDSLPQIKAGREQRNPTDKNKEYLDKMVRLAQKNNVQLAFIVVPYEGISEEDQMLYRWAEDYAGENGVLFFNGNDKLVQMGFDPADDYAEASHLNHSGACKFSAFLGQWLLQNCDLQDRRGGERWSSWQKYSDCWEAYHYNRELRHCTDITTYLEKIQECPNYITIVSLSDNYRKNGFVQPLEDLAGIDPYTLGDSASIVIEDNTIRYQTPDEPEYLWYMETELLDITISRAYGQSMEVRVNHIEQNDSYNDVTILVYDKKLDMVADVIVYNGDGVIRR